MLVILITNGLGPARNSVPTGPYPTSSSGAEGTHFSCDWSKRTIRSLEEADTLEYLICFRPGALLNPSVPTKSGSKNTM